MESCLYSGVCIIIYIYTLYEYKITADTSNNTIKIKEEIR